MTQTQFIKTQVQTTDKNIDSTLKLLSEDCTIPFIARYRKDQTGNLDEVVIEDIAKLAKQFDEIVKQKASILKTIEEQRQLSPELKAKIDKSFDLQEIEDLYLPYKKKKKTRADVARENGLEPLAKLIFSQRNENIDFVSTHYINEKVKNEDEALQGARDIIAEWINEDIFIRKNLRRLFQRNAVVSTKVVKIKGIDSELAMTEAQKFKQYFDWAEPLSKAPSHRLLAMLRAEKEGFIKLNIDIDNEEAIHFIEKEIIKSNNETTEHAVLAIKDSYKRLLEPAISNETLQEFKAKADKTAIDVFANNLSQLLLAPPLGEKRILAIDPNFDVTVRGSVSIGRRLSDPLAELVKIDPKSIGVGQYQHDVDQNKLKEELDATVIRCVNSVGININTASKHLLGYVSGIGEKLAENIVQYRTENGAFEDRKQLKKVPRLGEKAFQQGVAFIRIKDGKKALDNSAVHPEAYPIEEKMAKDLGLKTNNLIGNKEKIAQIKLEKYITPEIGILGLKDIVKELEKPGLDPRKSAKVFEFDPTVTTIKNVRIGMILPGIVNNITAFGCFVDIGIKESGLVHISQLKAGFVSDVNEVVKLHQHVTVKVVEVDEDRKRIQLTMVI